MDRSTSYFRFYKYSTLGRTESGVEQGQACIIVLFDVK